MDDKLYAKLDSWHKQIEKLEEIETVCLSLEASEKSIWAKLFLGSVTGKNVAEKEAMAYSHLDWVDFQNGLVAARVRLNKEKRILELKQAAYNAEYLTSKLHGEAIQRTPRSLT